jgi:DNA mismatch repair protein MutS
MTAKNSSSVKAEASEPPTGAGQTPLMRQYLRIKGRHPGTVLLFRMGDFYESFSDDARVLHDVLGITLTKRSNGKAADVALAGFPYHSIDTYLPKLVAAGLRVAVCEQLEDPKQAKGLVKRGVVEIVTPGVALSEKILDPKRSNYLASVHFSGPGSQDPVGVAWIDVSTAEFQASQAPAYRLDEMLQTVGPAEVLVNREERKRLPKGSFVVTPRDEWVFNTEFARETLLTQFGTHSLKGFGLEGMEAAAVAAGVNVHYLAETQQRRLPHIRRIIPLALDTFMALDPQTKRNLELVSSMQGRQDGSLMAILDHSRTPMGGRLLRNWLLQPLKDVPAILERLGAVDTLAKRDGLRESLGASLKSVGDISRISARAATGRASPRDLQHLRHALEQVPVLQNLLSDCDGALGDLGGRLDPMPGLSETLKAALADELPATLKDGGVIREGFDPNLDEIREMARSGKSWLARMQQEESEKTGIPSLKVGYNRVFGYYLEVTHAHRDKVPETYIRKQTLVNAERYITPELKVFEEKILTAEDRIAVLESELFVAIREQVADETPTLQTNAHLMATLDVFGSLAEAATRNGYVRPEVDDGTEIDIVDGRHPVVEDLLPPGEPFIPNSVKLDTQHEQIMIITGPNMAGKSVVIRQVGLIVLLAQVGSFVPATRAQIGVVDRIFTRVGASDNLAAGESTFLVEMNETANILNNATPQSLILLDEVGRGTSTFDGLSIAWALVEFLHNTPRVAARTLFATHYHELNELALHHDRIRNFRVQVQEHEGKVIFMRRLVSGGADHSYGIEVGRMAGLPQEVIGRAKEILLHLEGQHLQLAQAAGGGLPESGVEGAVGVKYPPFPAIASYISDPSQMSLFEAPDPARDAVVDQLRGLKPDQMTPMDALVMLSEMKSKLDA